MATIHARKRKDGSTAYRAAIRIKQKGRVVYQESRTFDRKVQAKDWAARRELELQAPGGLDHVRHRGVTIGDLIDRYLKEFGGAFGRSKRMCLRLLRTFDIADIDAVEMKVEQLVAHVVLRRKSVAPSTALSDLIWLGVVAEAARTAWGVPVNVAALRDATTVCRSQRLVSRPRVRSRRPSLEELETLLARYSVADGRSQIPMVEVVLFALFSARRESEITSLTWASLDDRTRSGVVRDMKHPREKIGNDVRVYFTDEAWAVIQRQPRDSDRVFPYEARSVSASFTRACKMAGIEDLRFHDLRHECVSWLFERGWDIPRVAAVSGHKSWGSLQRYTHIKQQEPHDKYAGWAWRPSSG